MSPFSSIDAALEALQERAADLERRLAAQADELAEARRAAAVHAALERVRAEAMEVSHSDEMVGIAATVFDELRRLGLPALEVGLCGPIDADSREVPVWAAGVDAAGAPRASHFVGALAGHPVLEAAFAASRTGAPFVEPLDPPAFQRYLRALVARYPASYADRVVARAPRAAAYAFAYVPVGTRQKGHLYAVLSAAPTPEALGVLERFAVLFSLAHARYRDLQQADAQTRTSQVEAALERVRARAMAMRRSDDLAAVAAAVLDELYGLGVRVRRSGVGVVVNEEARRLAYWSSAQGSPPEAGTDRLAGHALYDALFEAWRTRSPLSYILEGADLEAYYRLPGVAPAPRVAREYVHAVASPSGVLYAFAARPFAEDTVQVMERLAAGFHFAYARHLDLRQAEAQARESAQQASVDRVRAEIASMRTVADLDRITPLIWQELTALGVPFVRCGVFIVDEAQRAVRAYLATPAGAPLGSLFLPVEAHPLLGALVAHWREGAVLAAEWNDAEAAAWAETLEAHGLGPTPHGALGERPTAGLAPAPEDDRESVGDDRGETVRSLHFSPFAQGMLYVGGPAPLDAEDGEAVQALADAFEVAYARYDDFQRLDAQKREVEAALAELRATQEQLVQSEKLASLGALTAGIAHEIKNPLNFVNNFAALSRELAAELAETIEAGGDPDLVRELLGDLQLNAEKIERHGRRADGIVRGMMQHARGGDAERERVDLNALVEDHVGLAYHGRRAQRPEFALHVERDYDPAAGEVVVVPQEIGRVVINLLTNAFDAVASRAADEGDAFAPLVRVRTRRTAAGVELRVEDNGTGVRPDAQPRIFEPFFTTKPAGAGTGLGLSMSHDIVERGHGGRLRVESEPGQGATFVVTLPA